MSGLLGIWNNANQKFLHDYEDWYNNEHLFERLSVSNINVARRFQGLKSNYFFSQRLPAVAPDKLTLIFTNNKFSLGFICPEIARHTVKKIYRLFLVKNHF